MWVKEEEMEQYKALLEGPGTQWVVKNVESKVPSPIHTNMTRIDDMRVGKWAVGGKCDG